MCDICLDGFNKAGGFLSINRMIFAKVYKQATAFSALKANDILDYAEKLAIKDSSSSAQILFSLCVFMELNFIEFDEVLFEMQILKAKKAEIIFENVAFSALGGKAPLSRYDVLSLSFGYRHGGILV